MGSLEHRRVYDPVKAKEYYERTKVLKGRRRAASQPSPPGPGGRPTVQSNSSGRAPNRANTKSRRAQLEAQRARLEKRLSRAREVLAQLVEEAQSRSGVEKSSAEKASAKTESSKEKSSTKKSSEKPATASEKAKKAKAAREAYEKENPNSLSRDVEILKEQIKDIEKKIQDALAKDRRRAKQVGGNKARASSEAIVRPSQNSQRRALNPSTRNRKEIAQNGS